MSTPEEERSSGRGHVMSTELAQNRDARAWLSAHNYYYCGRCGSLIPVGYWHRCDDSSAHSAPHRATP